MPGVCPNSAVKKTYSTANTSRLQLFGGCGAVNTAATSALPIASTRNATARRPIEATDPGPVAGSPSLAPFGSAAASGPVTDPGPESHDPSTLPTTSSLRCYGAGTRGSSGVTLLKQLRHGRATSLSYGRPRPLLVHGGWMFSSGDEVLSYIRANDVQFVDVRFCDLPGVMQHFTVPT